MGSKKPPTPAPGPDDPTPAARLVIKVGPSQLAEGTVPPEHARHLITTFGVLGCVFTGVGGAVLTLHIAATLTILAFTELALALAASALIVACSRAAARGPARRRGIRAGWTGKPGRRSS